MYNTTYLIRDREAGNFIATFNTLAEAQNEIKLYEEDDRLDGSYTENFYEIVENKPWYAVVTDNDNDWGEGSYDLEDAKQMAMARDGGYIAVIDEGNDPVCVGLIGREECSSVRNR